MSSRIPPHSSASTGDSPRPIRASQPGSAVREPASGASDLAASGPSILAEIVALPEVTDDAERSVPPPPAPSPFAAAAAVRHRRRRKRRNIAATVAICGASVLALLPLASVTYTVLTRGLARFDAEFFTNSMRNVVGEGGGALHAIVGTLEITGLAAAISIPSGLLAAIYLVEYGRGRLAKAIAFFVDVMTGIPSIVAGLFAYSLFLLLFGPGSQNGIAGALALSVLMVPVVIRSAEEMLRLVPQELREASLALGVPRWRTILKVVLPTSAAGIGTGIVLAIARVIGETAPLLVTVGLTQSMNYSLTDGPMMTLPVFVYNSYMSQGVAAQSYVDRAWTGALVLILIVMALNLIARLISAKFAPKGGR